MRLAIVGHYPAKGCEPAGGVEVAVTRIADALASNGIHVSVLAPGAPDTYQRGDIRVSLVPDGHRLTLATGLRQWRSNAARILRELEVDVIHGHSLLACALAATDDRRPIPRIVTAHGNVLQDVLAHSRGLRTTLRTRLVLGLASKAVTRATAVVGVHPDWRLNVPVPVRRFAHIPNVVEQSFFEIARSADAPRVLYCGGARHVKGWDILAASWPAIAEAVPDATLEVLGWDADAATASAFGGSQARVEIAGHADQARIGGAMARATVIVLPSRFEIAPITLSEAWASGCPVVATAVGGVASLGRGAAVLVPPESPRDLARALIGILTGEIDTTGPAAEGRRRAEAFRADAVAAKHIDLYEELLAA